MSTGTAIVVGYDGSSASRRAAEWALREAVGLRLPVRLVRCYDLPASAVAFGYAGALPATITEDLHDENEAALRSAVEGLAAEHPDVEVSGRLVTGGPAAGLLAESEGAAMVVVGSRGRGGFRGLLLGSVSQQVATHAAVPVVVMRDGGEPRHYGRVVVAIDGSAASAAAIDFAFAHASRHGIALHAVHAWSVPVFDAPGVAVPPSIALEEVGDDEVRVMVESLAGWSERYPDVTVTREAVHGPSERVVVDASEGADLIVVGSRGRGGFSGLLLGSVSQAALHHAHCPVAVVRPA